MVQVLERDMVKHFIEDAEFKFEPDALDYGWADDYECRCLERFGAYGGCRVCLGWLIDGFPEVLRT